MQRSARSPVAMSVAAPATSSCVVVATAVVVVTAVVLGGTVVVTRLVLVAVTVTRRVGAILAHRERDAESPESEDHQYGNHPNPNRRE